MTGYFELSFHGFCISIFAETTHMCWYLPSTGWRKKRSHPPVPQSRMSGWFNLHREYKLVLLSLYLALSGIFYDGTKRNQSIFVLLWNHISKYAYCVQTISTYADRMYTSIHIVLYKLEELWTMKKKNDEERWEILTKTCVGRKYN